MTGPTGASARRNVADHYQLSALAVPAIAPLTTPAGTDVLLPGTLLTRTDWLAARIADTARRWRCHDQRVNASLWWYSASAVLLTPPIVTLLTLGEPVAVRPAALSLWLRPDGYLAGSRATALAPAEPQQFGEHLHAALHPVTETLARLASANPRALWAVAADSLAARALWADCRGSHIAERMAAIAAGAGMPPPRYRQRDDHQWVTRRCSCCLLYQTPDGSKCATCPRRGDRTR